VRRDHAAAPPTGVVNSRRFIQAVLRLMTNSMLGDCMQ
jgi:hypothetical protein